MSDQLLKWSNRQRHDYKKGVLSPERKTRLDDIGFEWYPHNAAWMSDYNAFVEYLASMTRPHLHTYIFVLTMVYYYSQLFNYL
jgi:hypothetical protein